MIMLVLVAYVGYHLLNRQEAARNRAKALAAVAAKSSSSSSSSSSKSGGKPLSSSDIRSGGIPSSSSASKTGSPAPKQVSSSRGGDAKKDPSSTSYKKNYFLTMQGPGRPALVPFQDGLRPKKGEAEGTMWWDNVPEGMPMQARESADRQMRRISWLLRLTRTRSRRR